MTLSHVDASDRLEAYVLGALAEHDAVAVSAHLARCAACRAAADAFAEVAAGLAESVPARAPSPELRARLLAAGQAEPRRRLASGLVAALRRPSLALAAALAALLAGSGVLLVDGQRELQIVREERDRAVALSQRASAERDEYLAIVERMSQAGRWWYMAGAEQFEGSGGTLVAPQRDGRAFVLFHDLRPLASPQRYVVWLIKPDGAWVRAADFAPTGQALQHVELALQIADFVQCAVTVETTDAGKRSGPLVMQSRIFTP